MTYYIGSVTDSSGTFDLAHYNLLEVIKNACDAIPNYTILRYETSGENHELIVKTTGISEDKEFFFGFRTYQNVGADYYNILCSTFTGYLSGAEYDYQPGSVHHGIPAHNLQIDHFFCVNEQRIILVLKIGASSVYVHGGAGAFYHSNNLPSQYPNPIFNAGMFSGAQAIRYSDMSISMPWSQGNLVVRDHNGNWVNPQVNLYAIGSYYHQGCLNNEPRKIRIIPCTTEYPMLKLWMFNSGGMFGNLDGVYYVPGFSNSTQNVLQRGGTYSVDQTGKTTKEIVDEIIDDAGGRAFVVFQNVYRTGANDYVAMEMI